MIYCTRFFRFAKRKAFRLYDFRYEIASGLALSLSFTCSHLYARSLLVEEKANIQENPSTSFSMKHESQVDILDRECIELSMFAVPFRCIQIVAIFLPVIILFPVHRLASWIFHGQTWWHSLLVTSLKQSGPMFIKLGQWISTRPDILSPETCKAFSTLQANSAVHPYAESMKLIEIDCPGLLTDIEEINPVPIGVGAVAQVYRAKIKRSGDQIAIKILHPSIAKQIYVDLQIVRYIGKLLISIPFLKISSFNVNDELELFSNIMMAQTDLRLEARNMRKFADNFKDINFVKIPKIFSIGSSRILVESYEDGILLGDFMAHGKSPFHEKIAAIGFDSFLRMAMVDNFLHADMHPGNILLQFRKYTGNAVSHDRLSKEINDRLENPKSREEFITVTDEVYKLGYSPQIVLLDGGIVTSLSLENLKNVKDCFSAGFRLDAARLSSLLISRSRYPELVVGRNEIENKLSSLFQIIEIDKEGRLPISKIFASEIVKNFAGLTREHRISLDGDFCGLFIASIIVEGIGKSLDSNLDLLETLGVYLSID